jgi:hypothetical protein
VVSATDQSRYSRPEKYYREKGREREREGRNYIYIEREKENDQLLKCLEKIILSNGRNTD